MKIIKKIDKSLYETEIVVTAKSKKEMEKVLNLLMPTMLIETIDNGIVSLIQNEMMYVKSAKNYVELLMSNKTTYKVRSTMKQFEKKLNNHFVRISRSYIINIHYLDKLETDIIQGMIARVGSYKMPVSHSGYQNLLQKIDEENTTNE